MTVSPIARRRRRGFTLVELLIVVAVLGVSMVIGLPWLWNIYLDLQLRNTAHEVLSMMRTARFKAIAENQDYTIIARRADIVQLFEGDDPTIVGNLRTTMTFPAAVTFAGPTGVHFDGFNVQGDDVFVVFEPDGSADSAGSVRLGIADPDNVRFWEVNLEPATTARTQLLRWNYKDSEWEQP